MPYCRRLPFDIGKGKERTSKGQAWMDRSLIPYPGCVLLCQLPVALTCLLTSESSGLFSSCLPLSDHLSNGPLTRKPFSQVCACVLGEGVRTEATSLIRNSSALFSLFLLPFKSSHGFSPACRESYLSQVQIGF